MLDTAYHKEYEVGSLAIIQVPPQEREDGMFTGSMGSQKAWEDLLKGEVAWFDMSIPDGTVVRITAGSDCGWYKAIIVESGQDVYTPGWFLTDHLESCYHLIPYKVRQNATPPVGLLKRLFRAIMDLKMRFSAP